MSKKLKLSAPWVTLVKELRLLFDEDSDVIIKYEDGDDEVRLFVADAEKGYALQQLIPNQQIFGNVILKVTVIPANERDDMPEDLAVPAFRDNPVVNSILSVSSPFGKMTYIMFRKEVVQFYNDELCDPHGNRSMLFEDIARDVFGKESDMFFCTDIK